MSDDTNESKMKDSCNKDDSSIYRITDEIVIRKLIELKCFIIDSIDLN